VKRGSRKTKEKNAGGVLYITEAISQPRPERGGFSMGERVTEERNLLGLLENVEVEKKTIKESSFTSFEKEKRLSKRGIQTEIMKAEQPHSREKKRKKEKVLGGEKKRNESVLRREGHGWRGKKKREYCGKTTGGGKRERNLGGKRRQPRGPEKEMDI